jgi:hypothetical protein
VHGGTLLADLLAVLNTGTLASLGPASRPDAIDTRTIEQMLARSFREARISPAIQALLRSILFLWHDHLDESHSIAQEIENQDGSLVHAIMHRREPDYGNAKYWLRRVEVHPCYLRLAVKARELLERSDETDLHSRLLPNNTWDPYAFVDAVEDASHGQFVSKIPLLQQIQKAEFESLIENIVNRI